MLFIPVAKAFNKFQGEYHLLEQAIRAVELHRVCRSYKYFERNRLMPGLPDNGIQFPRDHNLTEQRLGLRERRRGVEIVT